MRYVIDDQWTGKRLDTFLASAYPDFSRSFMQKLCDSGQVLVNGEVSKPGYKLRAEDQITLDYDFEAHHEVPEISLSILYEDADCIVINKPAGILTHSKGAFNPEGTVATFISSELQDLSGERGGIVHRLDRATSGVIICAKHPRALSWLQKQFSQRKVKKTYQAIVKGAVQPPEAIIDMPIERNPKKPQSFRAGPGGKEAVTAYRVIDQQGSWSLLELNPLTGRTHQLRVHLQKIGHPIAGDILYGGPSAHRLMLHAAQLEITLPDRTRQIFKAPLPESFEELLHG